MITKYRLLVLSGLSIGLAILAWIGVRSFRIVNMPTTASRPPCMANLAGIDESKTHWALEKNKGPEDSPTWEDLRPYLPPRWSNNIPVCPEGGTYTPGRIGERPKCSIGGPRHSLP